MTGREADFPTLSNRYSYDLTFNILGSLTEQTLTFKWKMMLLQLRVKKAVEADKTTRRRWKKNPRWVLHMHGLFLASLWGHIGSARQLCFNPKVYHLGISGVSQRGADAEEARVKGILLTDPNAPTTAEQRRRAMERCEVVLSPQDSRESSSAEGVRSYFKVKTFLNSGGLPEELHQSGDLPEEPPQSGDLHEELRQSGDLPEEPHHQRGVLHEETTTRGDNKRITLNRRQTRSIRQGVQKALKVRQRIYAAAHMKERPWAMGVAGALCGKCHIVQHGEPVEEVGSTSPPGCLVQLGL